MSPGISRSLRGSATNIFHPCCSATITHPNEQPTDGSRSGDSHRATQVRRRSVHFADAFAHHRGPHRMEGLRHPLGGVGEGETSAW